MSRSVKKGPYVNEKLLAKIVAMNESGEKKVLKTWSRASTIFPDMVSHTIAVHDGRKSMCPGISTKEHWWDDEAGRILLQTAPWGHAGWRNPGE